MDVFGLETQPYHTPGQLTEAWKMTGEAEQKGSMNWTGIVEDAIQNPVCEDLHRLRTADSLLAILLNPLQVVGSEGIRAERLRKDICCGDSVLKRDVDPDASNRRHRMSCVADAEQAR